MKGSRSKIGLFGGSFDPIHNGHVKAARRALEAGGLDAVWFMPTAASPFKSGRAFASARDRIEMVKRAVEGEPRFSVCDAETARGGISYTVDTVRLLRRRHPDVDFFFIIGADSLANLHQWHEAEALVGLCDFITLARPGWEADRVPGFDVETETRLRRGIIKDFAVEVSSSEIRRRVSNGESIGEMVPAAVAAYIAGHPVYRVVNQFRHLNSGS